MYCAHNWWLARQGHDKHDAGSRRGIAEHAAVDAAHESIERHKKDYRDGLRWFFRILGVTASATFLTLELVFLRAHPLHWAFLLAALVLLASSAALFVVALVSQREYQAIQAIHGIVPGRVGERGLYGGVPEVDEEWGVSGRPDYVIETDDGPVPVEVKTGFTPREPFDSHRMQLATYLRLQEASGRPPAYGMITYPKGAFRLAWDEQTQAELQAALARMQAAKESGVADRDHEHPGRCKGCARRDACDQQLA